MPAALTALALAGCGGGDDASREPSLRDPLARTTAEGREEGRERRGSKAKRERGRRGGERSRGSESDRDGGGGEGGGEEPAPGGGSGRDDELTQEDAERGDPEAVNLARQLERAKQVVGSVIAGINKGDAGICTRHFTQRYVETITGLRGQPAVAKCRRDIAGSRGSARITAFGPSRIEGRRASIEFNLKIGDRLTSERFLLAYSDGEWFVDAQERPGS